MDLQSLTRPELIFPELPGSDAPTVLRAFADRLAEAGVVEDADRLYERLWEREKLSSTAIGGGVAIPHCKLPGLERVVMAVGVCRKGVDFGGDEDPVRLCFLVVSPEDAPAQHLQSLATISRWVKLQEGLETFFGQEDREAIYQLLGSREGREAVGDEASR